MAGTTRISRAQQFNPRRHAPTRLPGNDVVPRVVHVSRTWIAVNQFRNRDRPVAFRPQGIKDMRQGRSRMAVNVMHEYDRTRPYLGGDLPLDRPRGRANRPIIGVDIIQGNSHAKLVGKILSACLIRGTMRGTQQGDRSSACLSDTCRCLVEFPMLSS